MELAELRLQLGSDVRIGPNAYRIGALLGPGQHSVAYRAKRLGQDGAIIEGADYVVKHPALPETLFKQMHAEGFSASNAVLSQIAYIRGLYHSEQAILSTFHPVDQRFVGIDEVDVLSGAKFQVTSSTRLQAIIATETPASHQLFNEIRLVIQSIGSIPISVLPFVPFPSLQQWSTDVQSSKEGLTADQVVSALRALVRTVDDLHSRLIVHNDLSARNVLINEGPEALHVVLIDFDQAYSLMDPIRIEEPRRFLRTYSLPERTPINFDSDIYQIGTLALYLMTGIEGFSEDDIEQRTDDSDGHDRWSAIVDSYLSQSLLDPAHPALAWIRSLVVKCTTPHYRAKYHTIHDLRVTINQIRRQTLPRKDFQSFKADFQRSEEVMTRERLLEEMLAHDDSELMARLTFARQVRRDFELRRGRSRLLSIYGDREDIVHFYVELIGSLAPGSKYQCCVTTSFWSNQNLGTNGRFLVACRLFVAKGGILSVLLIVPSILDALMRADRARNAELTADEYELLRVLKGQSQAIGMLDATVRSNLSFKVLVLDENDPEIVNCEGYPAFIASKVSGQERAVDFTIRNLVARRRAVDHHLSTRASDQRRGVEDFIFGVSLRRDTRPCSDALHLERVLSDEVGNYRPVSIGDYLESCGYGKDGEQARSSDGG